MGTTASKSLVSLTAFQVSTSAALRLALLLVFFSKYPTWQMHIASKHLSERSRMRHSTPHACIPISLASLACRRPTIQCYHQMLALKPNPHKTPAVERCSLPRGTPEPDHPAAQFTSEQTSQEELHPGEQFCEVHVALC